MSTTVMNFDANEFEDWFFHCHLLYHMESGMARLVPCEGFELAQSLPRSGPIFTRIAGSFGEKPTS